MASGSGAPGAPRAPRAAAADLSAAPPSPTAPTRIAPPNDPCPSCGRPLGGRTVCIYCAGKTLVRVPTRWLSFAALGLLVVSAGYFLLAAGGKTETVAITELTAEKHHAHRVQVRGHVVRARFDPDKYGKGGSLVFTVEDPESPDAPQTDLVVRATGSAALRISDAQKIPAPGDVVVVAGVVTLTKEMRSLALTSPDALTFERRAVDPTAAVSTTVEKVLATPKEFEGKPIRLPDVVVVEIGGPVVNVGDAGGKGTLAVFGAAGVEVARGQHVRVRGVVAFYAKRNTWEVKVARGDREGLVPLGTADTAPLPEVTVTALLAKPKEYEGKEVCLPKVRITKLGRSLTLDVSDADGKDSVKVFGVEAGDFKEGQEVRVRGTVEYYEKSGYWEVKVKKGDREGVVALGGAGGGSGTPPPAAETEIPVQKLLAEAKGLAGKRVRVRKAEVTKVREKWVIEVADPGGKESIVVFGVADPAKFKTGQVVTVRGVVEYYEKGEYWEIKIPKGETDGVVPYKE